MVSKANKPKGSPAAHPNRNLRRRRRTPVTTATKTASVVVASINKSIYTCHRRLIKIFSKLVRIATPKGKSSVKKGYQVLKKFSISTDDQIATVRRSLFQEPTASLPPPNSPNQKTVFLDLDETLIHSTPATGPSLPGNYDFVVKPLLDGERVGFYVLKRPFVDEFLQFLSRNNFEIVIFTAGIEEYASLVLDKLDWRGLISHRLYRNSCKAMEGKFVKDISDLGRDLKQAVIVDDNPNSYGLQPENAIPIKPFTDDLRDDELKKLMSGFFRRCNEFEDLRDAVKHCVGDDGVENSKSQKPMEDEILENSKNLKLEKWIEDEILENSKNSNFQTLIEV